MIPRACLLNTGLVLFSLIVLTSMPTFGYAKNVYQPENTRVSSGVVGTTEQAQVELNPNAVFGWSLESSGDRSLLGAGALHESLILLAQKEPKSEGKKPKAEAGKTGDKGSDASKKDDDDEDEDEEEEGDSDDDGDTGKTPATEGDKAPEKKKS
jgi:hypothetical protein